MTELDVFCEVNKACIKAAGQAAIVYGDFAVSPGPERRGGPPTSRVIQPGDMLILDYSVVIAGYRSDFTNTLVVGREPTADQKRLYDMCISAMRAGEAQLKAGTPCQTVFDAVGYRIPSRPSSSATVAKRCWPATWSHSNPASMSPARAASASKIIT
jgi:Xaa-Pro aminopeptidase